jgi:RNA polymerase sigma-70 factor, ECF subfamily
MADVSHSESWLDQHGDALFRYAFLRVRDSAVAEDLVQETLLAGLKALNRFQGRGSERTWLIGIMKHKIADHFRRTQREVPVVLGDWFTGAEFFEESNGEWHSEHAPADWQTSPFQTLERSSFWKAFNDCLAHMPARTASAFTLREVDGLRSEAICELLGISVNHLWVMLHRARMHLRDCLETNWLKASRG